MTICPCCNRRIPAPKISVDKRIIQDQAKVQSALNACSNALALLLEHVEDNKMWETMLREVV